MAKRRIVLLGGGLSGYFLAREIRRAARPGEQADLDITLLSPASALTLAPLLASVAGGSRPPWQASLPVALALPTCRHLRAEALSVDPLRRQIELAGPAARAGVGSARLAYDDLVVCLDPLADFGAVPGAEAHALPLRSVADALAVQGRLLDLLDEASLEDSQRRRRSLLTVVVMGPGLKACQAAAEARRLLERSLPAFPRLSASDLQLVLLAPGEELLPQAGRAASEAARRALERAGVTIRAGASLARVEDDHVRLAGPGEERIDTRALLWAREGACSASVASLVSAGGRVLVDGSGQSTLHEGVWAAGDSALRVGDDGPEPGAPGDEASSARALALALLARHRGLALPRGRPAARLRAFSIGPGAGVARLFGLTFGGAAGSFVARLLMLLAQPGFDRRLRVVLDALADTLAPPPPSLARHAPPRAPLYLTPLPAPVSPVIVVPPPPASLRAAQPMPDPVPTLRGGGPFDTTAKM